MPVLERDELEASPLSDLHAIADQLGLDGFRRLRKADLIERILDQGEGEGGGEGDAGGGGGESSSERAPRARARRRGGRSRRSGAAAAREDEERGDSEEEAEEAPRARGRGRRGASRDADAEESPREEEPTVAEGVVELLGNGSAFLRIEPPEPSDGDVYISAAQVRRCELVSGDRVSGPVRMPRRSERYPSLVRIDTINGTAADAVSSGARYDDLPADRPNERIALDASDATLQAIEWLTPFGRGSRVLIVGTARAGKTETLRALLASLSSREELDVSLVVAGARPEEIAEWQTASPEPAAALSFAASGDSQAQAVDRAVDAAKRVAARGGNAVVLIDSLDGLPPQAARKALAAARNLRDAGSLTIIATASRPFGGESTVIALDVTLTSTGRQPILDLLASGTLRPELLVGEDGAQAIIRARAEALESSS